MDREAIPAFQQFQYQMANYLRNPDCAPLPQGIHAPRMALYADLVFSNVLGFLNRCFPVCRRVLGDSCWQRLNRHFLRDWPLTTPWFYEIPKAWVEYLQQGLYSEPLPQWLPELAHYEWVELALDIAPNSTLHYDPQGSLLGALVLTPAHKLLSYQWPVHRISSEYQPQVAQLTFLLAYRNEAMQIRFIELNAVTARLIQLISSNLLSGQQALQQLATEMAHPSPQQLIVFGLELLENLHTQGFILGASGNSVF